jgi:hypothetical protein
LKWRLWFYFSVNDFPKKKTRSLSLSAYRIM